ncbi:UNVERIFIED_CONTAM: hypothetical protein K2H54_039588 [Gekko kuhli]
MPQCHGKEQCGYSAYANKEIHKLLYGPKVTRQSLIATGRERLDVMFKTDAGNAMSKPLPLPFLTSGYGVIPIQVKGLHLHN